MSDLGTFESVFNALADVADVAEMVGGSVPIIGSVVHGGEAIAHGGAAYWDHCNGDTEGAEEQAAMAAVNLVEAIPVIGTGVSIANGVSEYAKSQDGQPDLTDTVRDWMFGEKTPDVQPPSKIPPPQPAWNVEQDKKDKDEIEDWQARQRAEKVSQREREFDASGQPPAQHAEWAKKWDRAHGM